MLEITGIIIWMAYINKVCHDNEFRSLRYNLFVLILWGVFSVTFKTVGYFVAEETAVGADLLNISGFLLTVVITYTIIITDIRQRRKDRNDLLNV